MAQLNKTDSSALMALIEKPGWAALMKLVAMTINDLNSRKVPGQNAFEVLRSLHLREGKVEGLEEFFNGIESGVSLTDLKELR